MARHSKNPKLERFISSRNQDDSKSLTASVDAMIFFFNLDGHFSKMLRNSLVSFSRSGWVAPPSTYWNHGFPSVDDGMT